MQIYSHCLKTKCQLLNEKNSKKKLKNVLLLKSIQNVFFSFKRFSTTQHAGNYFDLSGENKGNFNMKGVSYYNISMQIAL